MGTITLPGLTTGIDTNALIKQLMAVESRRLAIYQTQKNSLDAQNTEISKLQSAVSSAKSAAAALSDADSMAIFNASSSDSDILTVSTSSDAQSGSHSIDVNQLAAAEKWIQDTSTFNYTTDYVGGGNFIYSYNNQERVITTVVDETTLEDLVNLINNDSDNPGVTASLLNYGGKYHLMLSGQGTGQDYQISLNESSTQVLKPDESQPNPNFTDDGQNADLTTKITELDQFHGSLLAGEKIIISGENHSGTDLPDGELAITANTTVGHLIDAINKHFDGVATARLVNGQIWLTDNTCGESGLEISFSYYDADLGSSLDLPTMTVATEGGDMSESLLSLDSSSFVEVQNAQSSKIKIDGYPAGAVNEVQTLSIVGAPTSGAFKLTFNGETTEAINFNATAADIQNALVALASVNPGDVVCTGSDLPGGPVTITFGGNLAGMDITKMTVSDSTLDAGKVSVVEMTKGNDGWIDRNSNSISDAITGVTLNLHDVTEAGKPVTVTVTRNTATITSKVQALVKAFNDLMTELKTDSEYDTDAKKMGILSNDVAVSFIKTGMRNPFIGLIQGFVSTIDSFVQAGDIGISIDGAGMLEFDQKKLSDAINEDYRGVLEVLGATKSGNSSSPIVKFSSASDKYTTAGTYDVKVTVEDGVITSAKIKLETESTYRDAVSWTNGIITFDNSFDSKNNPVYPENGLQLSIDLAQIPPTGEYQYGTEETPVIIHVKQGTAGTLEDLLNDAAKANGRLYTSKSILDEKITKMETRIKNEQARLDRVQKRLVEKYARLERTLSMLQQQMGAAGMLSQMAVTS